MDDGVAGAMVSAAVEGVVDDAVVRRLIRHAGGQPGVVYGLQGKHHLREKIRGYDQAARFAPWVVLVDLNRSAECAPSLLAEWLPDPSPQLCLRVAVRAAEAWLMADAKSLAPYIGVPLERMPRDPESLSNPKEFLVNLARRSRRKVMRLDLVPRSGSGRSEGPAYTSRIAEFASERWRPAVAARRSDSLLRAIRCLRRLVGASEEGGAVTPESPSDRRDD